VEGRALTGTSEKSFSRLITPDAVASPVHPTEPLERDAPANELDVLTGALWMDGLPHGDHGRLGTLPRQPARFVDPVSQWLRSNEAAGAEFLESRADELANGFTSLDVELVPAGQLARLRTRYEHVNERASAAGHDAHRRPSPIAAFNDPVARTVLYGLCPFVSELCRQQLVPSHTSSVFAASDVELPGAHADGAREVTLLLCLSAHAADHRGASHFLLGTGDHLAPVRARAGRGAVIRQGAGHGVIVSAADGPNTKTKARASDRPWALLLHYCESEADTSSD